MHKEVYKQILLFKLTENRTTTDPMPIEGSAPVPRGEHGGSDAIIPWITPAPTVFPWGSENPMPPPGWYEDGHGGYLQSFPTRPPDYPGYGGTENGGIFRWDAKPYWDWSLLTWVIRPLHPTDVHEGIIGFQWVPGSLYNPNDGKWIPLQNAPRPISDPYWKPWREARRPIGGWGLDAVDPSLLN